MPLHTHATEHVLTAVLSGLPMYMHTMRALTQRRAYKYAPESFRSGVVHTDCLWLIALFAVQIEQRTGTVHA